MGGEYGGNAPQIENPALLEWQRQSLRPLLLPSGSWVKVRIPSVEHLLRKGAFPHELEAMALRFTLDNIVIRQLDEEDRFRFLQVKDHLIVYSVRQRLVKGDGPDDPAAEWADVDLTPFLLDLEAVIPAEDLDTLGFVAIRMKTPEAVTADSKVRRMLADAGEAMLKAEKDAAPAAAEFRGVGEDGRGAASSEDGADVRLPAVERDGDRRPAARAAGRSGARDQSRVRREAIEPEPDAG